MEYIARSTAIGCVEVISAPKDSFTSSGTSLPGPTGTLKRLRIGTVNVLVSAGWPASRRNLISTLAS